MSVKCQDVDSYYLSKSESIHESGPNFDWVHQKPWFPTDMSSNQFLLSMGELVYDRSRTKVKVKRQNLWIVHC